MKKTSIAILAFMLFSMAFFTACGGAYSNSGSQNEETADTYIFKDNRNKFHEELNNGEIIEYFDSYDSYASEVYNMTGYQHTQREHKCNGLYVKICGEVFDVTSDGVIEISCNQAGDNLLDDFVYAEIVPIEEQAYLLLEIDDGDSIVAFAKLNDSSYSRDAILKVSFELYDPIIVSFGGDDVDIPQDYKPDYSSPKLRPAQASDTTEAPKNQTPDVDDSAGTSPQISDAAIQNVTFPCCGTYWDSSTNTSITITDMGNCELYVECHTGICYLFEGTVYLDPQEPYSFTINSEDGVTYTVTSYKENYSLFLDSSDGYSSTLFSSN